MSIVGQVKSPAKAAASRENGKGGGRPSADEYTAFKRLEIGATFSCNVPPHTGRFRKVDSHRAFALLPNGTGQTHKRIWFANSTNCRKLDCK